MIELLFFCFMLLLPIFWIIKLFIYTPIKNNRVFKLYKVRDELCHLALTGEVSENNDDYQLLMYLLNCEIAFEKNINFKINIMDYVKSIMDLQVNGKESDSRFDSLVSNSTLSLYTRKVFKLMKKRNDLILSRLKLVLILIFPFIAIYDLLDNHSVRVSKQFTAKKFNEYNHYSKTYQKYYGAF